MKVQVSDDVAGQVLALQGGPKAVTDIAKQKELFHILQVQIQMKKLTVQKLLK